MAFRRFLIDPTDLNTESATVNLSGDLVHHIREVCRFQVGDQFEVLPGDGRALLVEIERADKRSLSARVISARDLPPPQKPLVTLALSIPKLPKVDWIIEKCVELGVHEIRPFVSDYSFLRKVSEISPARLGRWEKLVAAATQQSGRGDLMTVHPAVGLKELFSQFNQSPNVMGLFPYEGPTELSLPDALKPIQAQKPEHLWIFVGSEGGFSTREVELFKKQSLKPVSMGSQILRVETACLALVSIIKYETGALC